MFKAKLINDSSYYALRSKHFLLGLLPGIVMAVLIQPMNLPWMIIALLIVLYSALLFLIFRNQRKMHEMAGSWTIELDKSEIILRTGDHSIFQSIDVNDLDRIEVSHDVRIHQNSAKDIVNESFGKPVINYIKIFKDESEKQYDFEVESHYMLVQWKKVVEHWRKAGLVKV